MIVVRLLLSWCLVRHKSQTNKGCFSVMIADRRWTDALVNGISSSSYVDICIVHLVWWT